MRTARTMSLLLAAAALMVGGCKSSLKDENAALLQENQDLRVQLDDRNIALDEANRELRDRTLEVSELRREMTGIQTQPASTGATGFENIAGVQGTFGAGEVTASIESDVLFDSGKATLKTAAKRALDQVISVLNTSYAGRPVRVGGHTDTDPIKKSGYKSNYHLGFERAYAVRDYLASRGIDANRLYLASYGPDRPRGSKPASRRVEIAVILN